MMLDTRPTPVLASERPPRHVQPTATTWSSIGGVTVSVTWARSHGARDLDTGGERQPDVYELSLAGSAPRAQRWMGRNGLPIDGATLGIGGSDFTLPGLGLTVGETLAEIQTRS